MSDKKPVAVIILNWNGASLLRRFLPGVIEHTESELADVIVADNGSTDDSLRVLADEFPQVKVIAFDENYGFAEGYNRALAMTRYRFTVLLNSDVELRHPWVTPLYNYMCSHPEVGALQPKILSLREPGRFEYAGASGGFIDRFGYPYCRGRIFDTVEEDHGQYDDSRRVFWASGAAMMVDTELYLDLGGLDPSFFAHMEEIDLCWRIQLAGRTVAVEPASAVWHLGGASLDASDPKKTYLNFRNNLLMLHKNLPATGERARLLIVRRLLDTIAMLKFAASGRFGHAKAIVKAHNDFRRMKGHGLQPKTPPTSNLLSLTPEGRRNILIDYYLRSRRTF